MYRTRAFRIHQTKKHKAEAVRRMKEGHMTWAQYENPFWHAGHWWRKKETPPWEKPDVIGIMATTPSTNSRMPNVPRKYGGVTRQELFNMIDALEDIEDEKPAIKEIKGQKYENPWSWD